MISPGMFGGVSAVCLGTADFMGRFSSRAIDHHNALLGMLIAGSTLMTAWVIWSAGLPSWRGLSMVWVVVNGVATMVMTLMLYLGLARGPVSVVAPIVAAHPVLVIFFYVVWHQTAPSPLQAIAMAITIIGTFLVAWSADKNAVESKTATSSAAFVGTVSIAICSCIAYAVLIVAGQTAAQIYGQVHTLWMGRLVSLVFLLLLFAARRRTPSIPFRWWPFVAAQGLLDAGGYIALFAGSLGSGKDTVAVVAATFGVVTVLLARVVLKEVIGVLQWFGILLVFAGVMVLSA